MICFRNLSPVWFNTCDLLLLLARWLSLFPLEARHHAHTNRRVWNNRTTLSVHRCALVDDKTVGKIKTGVQKSNAYKSFTIKTKQKTDERVRWSRIDCLTEEKKNQIKRHHHQLWQNFAIFFYNSNVPLNFQPDEFIVGDSITCSGQKRIIFKRWISRA